ncbi:uncharacterized protein LOC124155777 [Ischnura elegans]|uniref:uncharacterized protein LOC124155777 n=1 Tax=Ischnura elegans TaxID=197161 RepID=UPI001ED8AB9F|nr:uncharacterized protein LOC124155777 [Ischnura elegans]
MKKYVLLALLVCASVQAYEREEQYSSANEDKEEWPQCELGGSYSLPHGSFCDRFFTCQHGQVYIGQCEDGFGYIPFKGCTLLHQVDCTTRPKLQKPKGSGPCPRLNGIYADPRGCGHFYKCDNGTATADNCPQSLVFDDRDKICRQPTDKEVRECTSSNIIPLITQGVSSGGQQGTTITITSGTPQVSTVSQVGIGSQTPQAVAQFRCPEPGLYPYGDHARYPFPGNCRYYIMCLREGGIKVGGCQDGTAYNPLTSNCDLDITQVRNC